MNIHRMLGEEIPLDCQRFIFKYLHKGNILQSVHNIIHRKETTHPMTGVKIEQDLNFIMKVCKDYQKYCSDTNYSHSPQYKRSNGAGKSSLFFSNLFMFLDTEGFLSKKKESKDERYERKLKSATESIQMIKREFAMDEWSKEMHEIMKKLESDKNGFKVIKFG